MPLKSKFFKHLSQCSLRTYKFPYFLTLRLPRPDFSAKSRLWPGWGTVRDGQIGPSRSAVSNSVVVSRVYIDENDLRIQARDSGIFNVLCHF